MLRASQDMNHREIHNSVIITNYILKLNRMLTGTSSSYYLSKKLVFIENGDETTQEKKLYNRDQQTVE